MYQHAHGLAESVLEPAELVDKIRFGDKAAESEFANRYLRSLILLLRHRIKDDEFAVNECAQEAFLVTLEKMHFKRSRTLCENSGRSAKWSSMDYGAGR